MGVTEWTIVVLVVGGRLALPLLIPYFPVPALLACLILDSIDQSIFQQFPAIPLDGYQSYDKALDVYYLSVAYLSTLRNWTNQGAFRMSQFLYYYRMVGVVAFELTQNRDHPVHLPEHVRVLLPLRRARAPGLEHRPDGQVDGDPLGGRHLDLHQAAAGVVDPHRPARHDRLHQGDAVRGRGDRQLGDGIANRPWVLVAGDRRSSPSSPPSSTGSSRARRRSSTTARTSPPTRCRRSCAARSRTARSAPRPASSAGRSERRSRSRRSSASSSASCSRAARPVALRIVIGVAIFTVINAAVSHWHGAAAAAAGGRLAGELVTMLARQPRHRPGARGAGPLARRRVPRAAVRHDALLRRTC